MWGEDVRVRDKTKKKIASSLMNLVEKKPIDKITITDITVNCDISRQVFYRYFLDKKDLINWIYEEDCGSVIYTGEERFSVKSWLKYIIDILAEKKNFYMHAIKDDSSETFEKLILNKTRFYLKKIIKHKTKVELTKQLEFLVEMTARALVDMIIVEIESEIPVKKEILLDWLMNGMSKEISDLVEDYEVPMTVVKRWKM
jgi:probable dihydroxyacetone kinase regulator